MEIEVKAKLRDKDAVLGKLGELKCRLSEEKIQDDMVWVENSGPTEIYLSNKVFLRIRVEGGGRVIMTAKTPKGKEGDESLVKQEHEVSVDSVDEARNILSLMGLHEAVRVIKRRRTARYGDYEICIDDVEELGSFIEVERITADDKNAQQIQDGMAAFLKELGVAPEDQVRKGYDILMLEKG